MINKMQIAIIKKDILSITANKRMFTVLITIPLVMTVVLPIVFILIVLLLPVDSPDMLQLIQLLESSYPEINNLNNESIQYALIDIIINNVIPVFFILVPVMASSVMASGSFVGEKEKSTLETLFYCPLSLKKIFNAKITASFLLSMAVSVFSFIVMISVTETLFFVMTKTIIIPNINWIIILLFVSPSAAIISINLIVRNSAKAQSSEEAQQSSLFLVLPVILLVVGQFTGLMMISVKLFLLIAAVLAVIAVLTFRGSLRKFNYEALLH